MNRLLSPQRRRTRPAIVPVLLVAALSLGLVGCGSDDDPGYAPDVPEGPAQAPRLRSVPTTLGVAVGDGHGTTVSCATCHAMQPPNRDQRGKTLSLFHQDTQLAHGNLSCLSCHNESNYDALRLADGREVPFDGVMQLCAQCHGSQARDYSHGAHGGMSGYWDLTRGEQVRNQCTHCHKPHAPAFPRMRPTFKPRDRFLKHHAETHDD